jgi:hypothetical protein
MLYRGFIEAGLTYGPFVGCSMGFAAPLYVDRMFKLTAHGDRFDALALILFPRHLHDACRPLL